MRRFGLLFLLLLGVGLSGNAEQKTYSLTFNPDNYTIQSYTFNGKEYQVRAYENIIYVANPVDTTYQKLNIYVPETYYQGNSINDYNLRTAPIFYPNGVGGYMPATPMTLAGRKGNVFGQRGGAPGGRPPHMPQQPAGADMKQGSAIHYALTEGFVVVSAGARGRSLKNAEGVFTGKAPAGLVDLKAAICYLRYNDDAIPGDKRKIISNGTSAGGAMSMLLGATGNSPDYKPYLQEIGAADADDNIYAVSAYCPITDLDHADCAYEWQFNGVNSFNAAMMQMLDGNNAPAEMTNQLTLEQQKVSDQLKQMFPLYVNSLRLTDRNGNLLTLDEQGNGNFKEYVIAYVIAAAQKAINKGTDLSKTSWLSLKGGRAVNIDWPAYIKHMGRMKTPPAFDAFTMDAPENHLFGTASLPAQHFTRYSYDNSPDKGTLAAWDIIKMMNPLYYIDTRDATSSTFWHIRYGTIDNNIGLATEVILATSLLNKGYEVDFAFAWDRPHMGDYDLDELFKWIKDSINR